MGSERISNWIYVASYSLGDVSPFFNDEKCLLNTYVISRHSKGLKSIISHPVVRWVPQKDAPRSGKD
ncbi:hypothetical protein OUZ56_013636 [Daphnia magna]|uniref:Uncharacterized protein n=1 Tax=Daphnia magna TaxID=35525 RepID=A0ABQ9Z7M6_9CRUS|nr:hypothetical protein OUZ56_013636 [Daphnia magna]